MPELKIRKLLHLSVFSLFCLFFALFASSAQAQVTINEIRIDQPSTDNDEYFELAGPASASLSGLTYLVIGDGSGGSGVIEAVVDLSGQSLSGSGFFVAAEGTFTIGTADLTTSLNFENSDNVTHLLVSGFSGSNGDDLDTNDDGTLDVTPWSGIDDCVALVESVGSGDQVYCATSNGPDGTFVPAHSQLCTGGWLTGAFDPAGGEDTPGSANSCGAIPANAVINEVRIDQPSSDNDEYFELSGNAGGSLDGMTYLVIGDGTGGSGVIEAAVDLTGQSIPGSGFFVAAEGTFTIGTANLTTSLNFENSDNVTHLLVSGFTGSNGDDLDTNDDGTLDVTPWSGIEDCVALVETVGSGDQLYCATTVGPDGTFVPAHSFRCGGSFNIGAFDPSGGDDTPGAENDCAGEGSGGLVINEIDYDQPSSDTAEFIELKNVGDSDVNLGDFELRLVNGSGGGAAIYATIPLPSTTLAPGAYFVVCADASATFNCGLEGFSSVQNGGPDAVALFEGTSLVDTVSYEGDTAAPYTEGSGSGLTDPGGGGIGGGNDHKSISRIPDGVDTDVNNVDFAVRCVTPGSANSAASSDCADPRPPALRINEIDYDQPSSDTAEFIEIINTGNSAADLSLVELLLVNGSGGGAAIYTTIALPAVSLEPFDYFVVCKDSGTVANCDLEGFSSVQNGGPDAVALRQGTTIIDAVSYEGDTGAPYTEGSGSGLTDSGSSGQDNRGISRFPNGADTNQNNIDLINACITPGIPNTNLAGNCSPNGPLLEIFEIQGNGSASPYDNQGVATEDNVVTVVGPEGFFMQTPDVRSDADIDTSNGIYVYTDSAPGVAVGDLVDVSGGVNEFFDFTEFAAGSTVTVTGTGGLPTPVVFDDMVPSPDPLAQSCGIEFECYEGMLINIVGGTVTGPNQSFGTDPIAEAHITAAGTRTYREPGIEFPGLGGFPEWDGNPEVFELDPDKMGLANEVMSAGSHFDATGALGYEFGGYELWPSSLSVTPAPLPVAVRARDVNEMTVGALNLFRLYDDVDNAPIDVVVPGFPALDRTTDDEVRTTAEYERRLTKFSMYIRNVLGAPDVLAVSEVESLAVLQDLADWINADDGSINYTPYLEEGNDIGGIDVGFLVLDTVVVDNVTQWGRFEILDYDFSLLNDRPPLLLEGRQVADGSDFPFAVVAVHSRSLSGIDGGNGERVRQKRYEQAQSIAQKVQDLQTNDPDINLVVAGDFNAFEFTDGYVDATGFMKGGFDPLDNLVCTVFPNTCPDLVNPNLMNQVLVIPEGERYSFNFGGNSQTLDHALTSSGLDELIRDYSYGRGNADAYEELIEDDSTPLRSSDHDGLVLFMAKDSDGDGVTDDIDYCPATDIPEAAPTSGELRTNNFALVDNDRIFDTKDPNGVGPMQSFDIFDTAGCSCEQIVTEAGLGKGHLKFGCSVGEMEAWVEFIDSL